MGLRQSDVAKLLGAYTSTVNTWENGHFTPDVRFVPRIIEFLGYDPFGPPPTSFPSRLKAARIAVGLSRRQLAAKIGVHPWTVAEWERGETFPLRSKLERLARYLRNIGRPLPDFGSDAAYDPERLAAHTAWRARRRTRLD